MGSKFEGKWAVVTGASAGLGVDFATIMAEKGANLVLVARRKEPMEALAKKLSAAHGVKCEVLPLDLSDPKSPAKLHAHTYSKGMEVEVLINNAGFGNLDNFVSIPWEKDRDLIQVNIAALTHITKLYVQDMMTRNSGYVLLVGSISSFGAVPGYSTYAASKAYILSLGQALRYELRKTRIKISVLCPGPVATDFFQTAQQEKPALYQMISTMKSRKVARMGINAMMWGVSARVTGVFNWATLVTSRLIPRTWMTVMADLTGNVVKPIRPKAYKENPQEG